MLGFSLDFTVAKKCCLVKICLLRALYLAGLTRGANASCSSHKIGWIYRYLESPLLSGFEYYLRCFLPLNRY